MTTGRSVFNMPAFIFTFRKHSPIWEGFTNLRQCMYDSTTPLEECLARILVVCYDQRRSYVSGVQQAACFVNTVGTSINVMLFVIGVFKDDILQ